MQSELVFARVLKISKAVFPPSLQSPRNSNPLQMLPRTSRRGGASGVVAPELHISNEYHVIHGRIDKVGMAFCEWN